MLVSIKLAIDSPHSFDELPGARLFFTFVFAFVFFVALAFAFVFALLGFGSDRDARDFVT